LSGKQAKLPAILRVSCARPWLDWSDFLEPTKAKLPNFATTPSAAIKTSNGEYYAVSGMSLQAAYGKASSSGIEVSGEFIAAGDREKHNIVGTILAE
jgi:hypothetical protein